MLNSRNLILTLLCFGICITSAPDVVASAELESKKTAIQNSSAEQKLLALNTGMFSLYDNAQQSFKKEFLANHPLIISLFSSGGGKMILYRPGQTPEEAPPVPEVYQFLKSTGHSTLAISQVVLPFVNKKTRYQLAYSIEQL